ncbi:MAG: hypothetical protein ACXVHX_02200 [Solirubrobacteraceae bacterium]
MPSFSNLSETARDARQALQQLALETREVQDPAEIYHVLGLMKQCLAALAQSAHQLAASHDRGIYKDAIAAGDRRTANAAAYQVAWELHRAAEMLIQVTAGMDRAHEVEATIAYDIHPVPTITPRPAAPYRQGFSL